MPEIPQIRAPGRMAVDFGEGVTRLGSALTQIATGLQQDPAAAARQQAGLDVGEYDQVASATRAANSWKNSLKANLAQNPDYDMAKYEEDWQALSSDLLAFATLPAAYVKVQEMLTKIRDETESFTMDTVALRQVAKDEALYLTNRDDFVQAGDVAGLTAEANYAFSKGIITEAEMVADLEQQLPKARYNLVVNTLESGDPAVAIASLMAGEYDEQIDAEQKKKAIEHFQFKREQLGKLADSIGAEEGARYWAEYDEKRMAGSFTTIDEMERYLPLVDKNHRETVRADIERERKAVGDGLRYQQDKNRDRIIGDLFAWAESADGSTPMPLTDQSLSDIEKQMYKTGEPVLAAGAAEQIRKAMRDADAMKDDRQSTSIMSRLYRAVDEGTNPALAVTIKEIDRDIQDRARHDDLLAKRLSLQNEYESRKDSTKVDVLLDGYDIVYHPTMSVSQKQLWIDQHVGAGLSTEDGKKLRGWIDPYNENPDRKGAMDALTNAFRISMSKEGVTQKQAFEIEMALYDARNRLEQIFIDPKTTKSRIDQEVEAILLDLTTKDLEDLVTGRTGVEITGYRTGEYRAKYREATAMEYLRETGELTAEEAGKFKTEHRDKAEALERDAIGKAGLDLKYTTRWTTGDLIYSDKPIVKGTTGNLYMTGVGGQGTLRMVRYQVRDGEYVPTIYKQDTKTGAFTIVEWEWR